jgi:5-formyltetrahydrofolate cyclo-ligase
MRCSHDVEAKRLLRSRLVAARTGRSIDQLAAAGDAIAALGAAEWQRLRCVAAYAGVGTEPPTRRLIDRLTDAGVRVLLPIIDGSRLRWATYQGWDSLERGPLGIPQPAATGAATLTAADLVIAPALAVDEYGHRLGRGAGYYDRALADIDPSAVVAIVFDDEVVDDVPVEPHDRPVGAVLTPVAGLRPLG